MTISKKLSLLLTLVLAMTMFACGGNGNGGDDDPDPLTPEEERILALAGTTGVTWAVTSATFEGAGTDSFDGLTITFRAAKTYSTAGPGDPVFGSSGTWDFNSGNLNQLVFDGDTGNIFIISNLSTTATPATVTLTVDFNDGGAVAAGTEGTNGEYVFNLQAQ